LVNPGDTSLAVEIVVRAGDADAGLVVRVDAELSDERPRPISRTYKTSSR
jgi:hypothetical protein